MRLLELTDFLLEDYYRLVVGSALLIWSGTYFPFQYLHRFGTKTLPGSYHGDLYDPSVCPGSRFEVF